MSKEKLKSDFNRIKAMGFVKCTRSNNKDGGIGNTFEDLLGVVENNRKEADYLGFEIKSKRQFNESYISLFSKSPSFPPKANTLLRETFGEIRDENHPDKKKLYASVFGHRFSIIYEKYKMKLEVNNTDEKVYLRIYNLQEIELLNVFWTFESLRKASSKMKSLLLVLADSNKKDDETFFHFNEAEIYENFKFENFLESIKNGEIMFDIRIGVHNSGRSKGKTHDHGSGFRVKRENFGNLYESFQRI